MFTKRLGVFALIAGMTQVTAGPNGVRAQAQAAPDPSACKGLLATPDRIPPVLSGVPKYASTYVLVIPQRVATTVPAADAPALKEIEVGIQSGTPAVAVAGALGLTKIREYRLDLASAGQPLRDIADEKLDAAIMWAPLAGLAIIELGLEERSPCSRSTGPAVRRRYFTRRPSRIPAPWRLPTSSMRAACCPRSSWCPSTFARC